MRTAKKRFLSVILCVSMLLSNVPMTSFADEIDSDVQIMDENMFVTEESAETAEEVIDEAIEEVADEVSEEVIDEAAEEVTEKTMEEVTEETDDNTVDEVAGEVAFEDLVVESVEVVELQASGGSVEEVKNLLDDLIAEYYQDYEGERWVLFETKLALMDTTEMISYLERYEYMMMLLDALEETDKVALQDEYADAIDYLNDLANAIYEKASVPSTTASTENWFDTDVTDSYYNIISEKHYGLVAGAEEAEIVLNNSDASRRQVVHVFKVDGSQVDILPGYYGIDKDVTDTANQADAKVTDTAAYYESELGYDIVGGMNIALAYDSNAPYTFLVYEGKVLQDYHSDDPLMNQHSGSCSTYLAIFKDGSVELRSKDTPLDGTEWHAVGANFGWLVKDGELVTKTVERTSSAASRSMLGVLPDGSLIMCMVDGRGANNSIGLSTYEMGEFMLALGCVNAVNGDGGGSSTFISKREGENTLTMRSVPSDGSERPTLHSVFLAKKEGIEPGTFDHANILADYDYFVPNTTYTFSAMAIDTTGAEMDMPTGGVWSLSDDSFGTIDENGTFVSNGRLGDVTITYTVSDTSAEKTITVVDPTVAKFTLDSTVLPYGKSTGLTLDVWADAAGEYPMYFQADSFNWTVSDESAGTLDLDTMTYTATTDETVTGVALTATYKYADMDVLNFEITYGKGSEILAGWDFESGDVSDWMGFVDAKQWSIDNNVSNTLIGSNPLEGQFNEQISLDTFLASESNGQVKNGKYALGITMDYTDAGFAGWSYNVIFNVGEKRVLRDVENGLNATTLGMWLYIPEGAEGLAFQSQLWDGTKCVQDHFTFTTVDGTVKNLNSCVAKDIPASRWVYASIDISKYDYLSTMDPYETYSNTRSPSFIRTYVKPLEAKMLTFYIDDITLDYSTAVDDREAPIIGDIMYATADESIEIEDAATITSDSVAFSTTVTENTNKTNYTGLDVSTAQIYVDGVKVETELSGTSMATTGKITLGNGAHTVTFEIADNMGNYAQKSALFNVEASEESALVYVDGHNDSGATPEYDSIYYVDIKTSDVSQVEYVETNIQLNTANTWELEHMIVAPGYEVEYVQLDAGRDYGTYSANTDIHSVENVVCIMLTKTDDCTLTGEQTLVSIPVRVWSWDGVDNVTGEAITPEEQFATGYCPIVTIDVNVLFGYSENSKGDVTSFGGSYSVETMINDDVNPWHEHEVVNLEDKAATCTEEGYTGRTYCYGCSSVIEWGTTCERLDHNYQIVDGKFVCQYADCGQVYESGTGVFEMNGDLYYSIAGTLMKGWQYLENGCCFANSVTYKLAIGEATINGITYTFDDNGTTEGAWFADSTGTKFSYGPDYYRCNAGNPYANVVWAEIDGNTYAFDRQGYRHEGIRLLVESNNPGELYEFTDDGVLIGKYVTDHSGIFVCNGMTVYLENGTPVAAGLVIDGEDYYYINSSYRAVTGVYNVTRPNGLLPAGEYEFDADGKMINPPEIKNGPQEDGYFYINGVLQQAYKLVEYKGDYYFINDYNKYVTNKTLYLGQQFVDGYMYPNGDAMLPGYYNFDEEGKMIIINGVVGDNYYINGVVQNTWELFEWEGDFYFNEYYSIAKNKSVYLGEQFVDGHTYPNGDAMLPGYYNFDEDGKMIILNGVYGDYYYINGIIQKTWELFEWEGNFYFNEYYNIAKNKTVYLVKDFVDGYTYPNGDAMLPGYYNFDEDGKMVILNGVYGDYYYINGIVQKTWELFEWEGNFYFNEYYNIAKNKKVYLGAQFVADHTYPNGDAMLPGYYNFNEDGKMIILNGVYGDYYYINGIIQNTWELIEWEGNFYFNEYYNIAKNKKIHLNANFLEGTYLLPGYYEFDVEGKMIGHVSGIRNGRDLGEIPFLITTDGYDIKSGLLIRGGELDNVALTLSEEQRQEAINALNNEYGMKTEMDLRADGVGENVLGESILHKYYDMVMYEEVFTTEGMAKVKEIFEDLANPENYPIYLHCSYGVDRTGTVCYILEAVLGVSEDSALREYLLSVGSYGNFILKVRDGLKAYGGATIKECAEAYLIDCGLSQEQIEAIRDIFVED